MNKNWILYSLFLAPSFAVGSSTAIAGPTAAVHAGYGQGALTRNTTDSFTGMSTHVAVGYEFWGLNLHGFFQHMQLTAKDSARTTTGFYSLSGVGVGGSFESPKSKTRFTGALQVPLTGVYTMLSESTGTINGFSYTLSELTSLYGGTAWQLLAGMDYLMEGRGQKRISSSGKAYGGLYISQTQQQFTKQRTRIKTNNSVMAPISPGEKSVSYSAAVTSVSLALTFMF